MAIKTRFLLIGLLFSLILLIGVSLFLKSSKTPTRPVQTLPTYSPGSSVNLPVPSTPPQLQDEAKAQAGYAEARAQFLQQKPWVLDMPLKSDSYYIFYNSSTDQVVVKLYYSSSSTTPKQDQLSAAKQQALDTLKKENIDSNTQTIVFVEKPQ